MAVSEYYVSPGSGNDTTGNGTSGTPWATVQKALNTITRNATDGDRINVQASTADTLTAALSLATYGTPTDAAQLTIQGYTTSAGDGGIGVIDGAATYSICTGWTYANFIDMKVGNCGSADVLDFGTAGHAVNCEIHTSSGFGVDSGTNTIVLGCWFHDLTGTQAIDSASNSRVLYSYFEVAVTTAVIDSGAGAVVIGNIIDLTPGDTTVVGIDVAAVMTVMHNTIYCSGSTNTSRGIYVQVPSIVVLNNVVEGWAGTGGDGIETTGYNTFVGANAAYNCTAAYTLTSAKLNYAIAPNDTLGSSALNNPGSNDFSIKDSQTGVTEDAYPASFRGL